MKTEKLGTATYSPEDNKLRLSPFARLSKEDYERARSAGFIWAPKQELFVAPMWTPDREDLLLEWCGEIEDEDKGLVERAEERAERFEDYGDKRKADADSARAAVESITSGIPLGQPILVGHHSERRARRDAERIENSMRKAVKMWETSQYWKDRAASAIHHAKYKERPDVRARRIKKLEAEKRGSERTKASAESCLRFWHGKFLAVAKDGSKSPVEITEANREKICRILGNSYELSFYASRGLDGQGHFSGWDVLKPDGERYKNCPPMTIAELQAAAFAHYAPIVASCDRWLAHYENRLTYERAMLEADGGTEADKNKPEKGGACRCWVNRSGWCEIVKVNKVSVTVMDNWGDGGPDFPRTVPFDKLSEVISKAQWDGMKAGGSTVGRPADWREKAHAEAVAAASKRDVENAKFEALRETAKSGVQVVSAPQLFPTPPELAKKMTDAAGLLCGRRILEPSAGTGNLIRAAFNAATGADCCRVVAVEINHALAEGLRAQRDKTLYANESIFDVRCADFLQCNGDLGLFDVVLMNPPFERGSDVKHIQHALKFLKTGGKLVAICANGPRQREALQPLATLWEDLPEGTFKDQGTNVSTALLVIDN